MSPATAARRRWLDMRLCKGFPLPILLVLFAVPPASGQPPDGPTGESNQATPIPRGELLFRDHFDDEFLDQWQAAKEEGTLLTTAEPPGVLNATEGCYITTKAIFPPERIMEFRVKIVTPNDFDVCALPWFAEDREEFHQLSLTPGGCSIHEFQLGLHGLCAEGKPVLTGDGWHDVAVRIADRKIAFWVDEKLIHVCSPESVPEDFGRVGFRGKGMKIDDVAVYEVAPAAD